MNNNSLVPASTALNTAPLSTRHILDKGDWHAAVVISPSPVSRGPHAVNRGSRAGRPGAPQLMKWATHIAVGRTARLQFDVVEVEGT